MKTIFPEVGKARHGKFQRLEISALVLAGAMLAGTFAPLVSSAADNAKKAAKESFDEYEVKAVFLLNFANYTEWPASAFADEKAPLRIGVLGEDPFGAKLEATLANERVHERAVELKRSKKVEELKDCHIVFVCRSEKARLDACLTALKNSPVLTVGEIDGFGARCGMVNFVLEKSRIRLEINSAVVRQQGLKISPQVLSLARIVECESSKGKP